MCKTTKSINALSLACCVATTSLFMVNAVAQAQTPPLERYTCYQVYAPTLTYTYMGYFTLQSGKKYVWGVGKAKPTGSGRYSFGNNGILFLDGPLKDITGKFETKKDGRHLLKLTIQGKKRYPSDTGKITWVCNCVPHDPHGPYNTDEKK